MQAATFNVKLEVKLGPFVVCKLFDAFYIDPALHNFTLRHCLTIIIHSGCTNPQHPLDLTFLLTPHTNTPTRFPCESVHLRWNI